MNAPTMHCGDAQQEMRPCPYCRALFTPKRRWGAFCSSKCRTDYDVDIGAQGSVAGVRRINKGASIVIHLTGPAAERALKLGIRDLVRVVKVP